MEVGGVRPAPSTAALGVPARHTRVSGSLLAAALARSRGQSAWRAGPAWGSLFLFPGPSSRLKSRDSGSWVGWGAPNCARAQKRSRPPSLIPA